MSDKPHTVDEVKFVSGSQGVVTCSCGEKVPVTEFRVHRGATKPTSSVLGPRGKTLAEWQRGERK